MVCAKLGWNLLSVSKEENENVKSLRQLQEDEEDILKLLSQLSLKSDGNMRSELDEV